MSDAQPPEAQQPPQAGQSPQPYAPGQSYGVRPRVPDSTSVYTPFIWILALIPLLGFVNLAIYQPEYRFTTINGIRTLDPSSIYTPSYFVILAIGLVAYALSIVLAYLDRRELQRRGVERPFHWAWAFLNPVYMIGRAVIVHRVASPRGLAPLWLWLVLVVVNLVTTISVSVARTAEMFQQLGS